jgi:RNA-directed DNA polymerase
MRAVSQDQPFPYRPGLGGADAIKEMHRLICRRYTDRVDTDLSKYFDTIPHRDLMQCVARRIVELGVLHLVSVHLGPRRVP